MREWYDIDVPEHLRFEFAAENGISYQPTEEGAKPGSGQRNQKKSKGVTVLKRKTKTVIEGKVVMSTKVSYHGKKPKSRAADADLWVKQEDDAFVPK